MCFVCSVHLELCSFVSTRFDFSLAYCVVGSCGTWETNHFVSQIVPSQLLWISTCYQQSSKFLLLNISTSLGPEQLHVFASKICWSLISIRQLCGMATDLCETRYT